MGISIINYTKKIAHQLILDHVNLELETGKIYGFQGRNGSGKTMLFRAICRLIEPTSGEVSIDGQSVTKGQYDMRNIGVLIEHPGFFPYLSGYENLKLLADINHIIGKEEINEILKTVGLFEARNKKYRKYSLGMKQRLGIAQALMENQKYIILDEPFNGIDESGVEELKEVLKDVRKQGRTILLSSHNEEDLLDICDQIFRVSKGEIVDD